MRKFLKTVSAFIVALSMGALPLTAEGQHNGGRQSHFSSGQSERPSGQGRPSHNGGNQGGGSHRPGNGGNPGGSHRPGNNDRPGNGGNHRPGGNNRPGNSGRPDHRPGNGGHRPGGDHRPDYRPDHRPDHNPGYRPGGNPGHRPGGNPGHRPGHNPGYRPGGHRPGYGQPAPPPPPPRHGHNYRHHVPFFGHYHRPVPPPRWTPRYYGPSFGTILGLSFGTAINISVNALINQGYTVSSYGDNVVYLSNVPQMNYYWPDAALYYNNGALCGSTFTYPSAYYDTTRYNALYNEFCRQYGVPVNVVNGGGVMSATWFGNGNRFVTLEFNSSYGNYYTSLSFGM